MLIVQVLIVQVLIVKTFLITLLVHPDELALKQNNSGHTCKSLGAVIKTTSSDDENLHAAALITDWLCAFSSDVYAAALITDWLCAFSSDVYAAALLTDWLCAFNRHVLRCRVTY